jgi:hypothetical protein
MVSCRSGNVPRNFAKAHTMTVTALSTARNDAILPQVHATSHILSFSRMLEILLQVISEIPKFY